jgi:hypothetical protein
VRYRIDCIGDAIDPALHNMPMNQSEIKRKKNLSLSQAFSDWTAFATISNTNHLCCGAAAFGEGSRRPGGRFRRRAGPCWRLMADHKHQPFWQKGMTTLPCLKAATRKNPPIPVRQDASPVEAGAFS